MAFAIASAAVDSRPKDPAPMVVPENHFGHVLDNQDSVRVVICAAAVAVFPAEPCTLWAALAQSQMSRSVPTEDAHLWSRGGVDLQNGVSRP